MWSLPHTHVCVCVCVCVYKYMYVCIKYLNFAYVNLFMWIPPRLHQTSTFLIAVFFTIRWFERRAPSICHQSSSTSLVFAEADTDSVRLLFAAATAAAWGIFLLLLVVRVLNPTWPPPSYVSPRSQIPFSSK